MKVFRKVEAGAKVASGTVNASSNSKLAITNINFTPKLVVIIGDSLGTMSDGEYNQRCRGAWIDIENNVCRWWNNFNLSTDSSLNKTMPTCSYSGTTLTITTSGSYQGFVSGKAYRYMVLG